MTPSISYRAVNSKGVIVRLFDDEQTGRDWIKAEQPRRGRLKLQEVIITEKVRTVYRPRFKDPEDFSIPQIGISLFRQPSAYQGGRA